MKYYRILGGGPVEDYVAVAWRIKDLIDRLDLRL